MAPELRTLCLDGQSWNVAVWGQPDRPALLLLHGFTGSHKSWDEIAPAWAEHFWVIAPDLPGHGSTDTPSAPQDLGLVATAHRLARLLERLSIAKATVLGYSMGGRLALHFAWKHAMHLSVLILESASPGIRDVHERQARRERDDALAADIEMRGLDWFVPHWANQPLFQSQSEAVREAENRIRWSQSAHGLAQSLRGAGTGRQDSLWDNLSGLHIPVLLITGHDDAKFTLTAQRMREMLPDASWVRVPDAGHTVHRDQPERFREIVLNFLATTRP